MRCHCVDGLCRLDRALNACSLMVRQKIMDGRKSDLIGCLLYGVDGKDGDVVDGDVVEVVDGDSTVDSTDEGDGSPVGGPITATSSPSTLIVQ